MANKKTKPEHNRINWNLSTARSIDFIGEKILYV